MPASITNPVRIDPTVVPPTVTLASLTRCRSSRICSPILFGTGALHFLDGALISYDILAVGGTWHEERARKILALPACRSGQSATRPATRSATLRASVHRSSARHLHWHRAATDGRSRPVRTWPQWRGSRPAKSAVGPSCPACRKRPTACRRDPSTPSGGWAVPRLDRPTHR